MGTIAFRLLAGFLLVLAASAFAPARADYNMKLVGGNVLVSMAGDFVQGIPNERSDETFPFGSIPVFQHSLQGENSSYLSRILNNAIRMKTPSAYADQVKFYASSNGTSMSYELSFQVGNISKVSGDVQTVDFSWRSFVLTDDFTAGNVSVNRIVPTYLQKSIVAQLTPPPDIPGILVVRTWYLNNRVVQAKDIPGEIENLVLFNFASLSLSLQEWATRQDPPSQSPTAFLQSRTGLNVTYIILINEGGEISVLNTNLSHRLRVTIETPLPAKISDDEVSFETGGLAPLLMTAIVAVSSSLFAITYVAEKRLRPSFRQSRKSSKR